ncbi:MAG TPA: hypothetical protein ENJ00_00190 [Phycisphaerales bacterium]|nr:hypothetical protein [Phycisphaerales bacterium]
MGTRKTFFWVMVLIGGLVACGSLIPREGWDASANGPVIPHDNFPADCSLCHVGGSWTEIRDDFEFDHLAKTGVELKGAHADAACLRCHNDRGPVAVFADRGCSGCHEDTHRGRLGPDCQSCHNEESWHPRDAIRQHAMTRFPLVGPHASAECFACHEGAQVGNFEGLVPECAVCHTDEAASVTDPDHSAFSNDCQRCHSEVDWKPAQFDHPASFPLTNGHSGLDCSACHLPNTFEGLSTDCASCHTDDYNATTDPNHITAGFSTDCMLCHDTSDWNNASFEHPASFQLVGGHDLTDCSLCHIGGVFEGTPTDCAACHLDDYNATTDPNHITSGFSTDCMLCHDVFDWGNADFEHPASFPLIGGHNLNDCTVCHINNVFEGTPSDCAACHTDDYNATTNPDHAATGFPLDCMFCHNVYDWNDATFDHSFPIDRGAHKNLDCIECHTVPSATPAFSCIDCHEHRQSRMDDKHDGVSGYVWESSACFMCHPDGKE